MQFWSQNKRHILVFGGLLFLLTSCTSAPEKAPAINNASSLKATHDQTTYQETAPTKVDTGSVKKTDFEIQLCKTYDEEFFSAVARHLTAKIDDYASLQAKGLSTWIQDNQSSYASLLANIKDTPGNNYCDLFTLINRTVYQNKYAQSDKDNTFTYQQYAIFSLNVLFHYSLQYLDRYSYVPNIISLSHPEQPLFKRTFNSLSIPLLDRVDYAWRKPTALVVDPSYNGNLNSEGNSEEDEPVEIAKWSLITAIKNYRFTNFSFEQVQDFLRLGVPEGYVQITLSQPNGNADYLEVKTTPTERENDSSVKSHFIDYIEGDQSILYIRVSQVSEKSKDLFLSKLPTPLSEIKKYKGMIIDFSSNRGGDAEFAGKIAATFLPFGSPLYRAESQQYTKGKKQRVTELYTHQYPSLEKFDPADFPPTIVILSRATASA
ncbi:MAG: hypothetical protein KDK51_10940, partial [Deltaproteobacteria bacterium]|nr:hypothetical protein [Deltaproteobacteria bacterium]